MELAMEDLQRGLYKSPASVESLCTSKPAPIGGHQFTELMLPVSSGSRWNVDAQGRHTTLLLRKASASETSLN
jgi:hypothetical protein